MVTSTFFSSELKELFLQFQQLSFIIDKRHAIFEENLSESVEFLHHRRWDRTFLLKSHTVGLGSPRNSLIN